MLSTTRTIRLTNINIAMSAVETCVAVIQDLHHLTLKNNSNMNFTI